MTEEESYYNGIFQNFAYFTTFISILVAIYAIIKWNFFSKPIKYFCLYLFSYILLNGLEYLFIWVCNNQYDKIKWFLQKYQIGDTNFLAILYYTADYTLLAYFLYLLFHGKLRRYVGLFGVSLLVFSQLIYWKIDGYNKLGFINPIMNNVFMLVLSSSYLWQALRLNKNLANRQNPLLLICFGLLIVSSITLLYAFVADTLYSTSYSSFVIISIAKDVVVIIGQIFYTLAFYHCGKLGKKRVEAIL